MDERSQPRAGRRRLTHVDRGGRPRMVDISAKPITARRAVAEAEVVCSQETLSLVIDGRGPKGDVLTVAEIAGVMGGKRTSDLIPLCHPLALTDLVVSITPDRAASALRIRAEAATVGPDRGRDGGARRRERRGPHGLRHGEGRREGRRDPACPPRQQGRRQVRRVAARGIGPAAGTGRPTGWRAHERVRPERPARIPAEGRPRPGARRWNPSAGAQAGALIDGSRRPDRLRPHRQRSRLDGRSGGHVRRRAGRAPGLLGFAVEREMVPDERRRIESMLVAAASRHPLVVTTGGTGLTPRDVTPQATLAVIDYQVPGFAEAMRADGRAKTPMAILSRAVVGVRGQDADRQPAGQPARCARVACRARAGPGSRARDAARPARARRVGERGGRLTADVRALARCHARIAGTAAGARIGA